MKRPLMLGAALALLVFSATPAIAAKSGTDHYTFAGSTDDGSSCGGVWAHDTYTLDITVRKFGSDSYAIHAMYKNGSFVTYAGSSPGGCSDANHHGSVVAAGINGSFQGFVDLTVSSSTYDPDGCVGNPLCTSRTAVLHALFGTYSSSDWSWNFEYRSKDKSLAYRAWQDKSDTSGNDKFEGDIANS